MVLIWNPETWDLSELKVIFIDKAMRLAQFRECLLSIYPELKSPKFTRYENKFAWYFNRVQLKPYEM